MARSPSQHRRHRRENERQVGLLWTRAIKTPTAAPAQHQIRDLLLQSIAKADEVKKQMLFNARQPCSIIYFVGAGKRVEM